MMTQETVRAPDRSTAIVTTAAKRRRSVRIADSALVVGFVVSYFTTSSVTLHAVVSLLWTAIVGWHFWLHRKWFKSVARRLSKKRSRRSRGSALVTVTIAIELSIAIALGIAAWVGPRSLKGVHGTLANILVFVAVAHILSNTRQVKALIRRRTTVIDRRFRGSADSAQGGYAAGTVASLGEGVVRVEMYGTAPVGEALPVEIDSEDRVTVFHESVAIMHACPDDEISIEVPATHALIDAIFARGPVVVHGNHDRPHCFGCSVERDDGLGIATLPIGETGIWATIWTPHDSLPSKNGFIDDEILWAALDCPGSFAASDPSGRPPGVTGSPSLDEITVDIRERVRSGEKLAVMGWTLGHLGTRVDCGTAIVDRAGRVKAIARTSHTIDDDNVPHGAARPTDFGGR